MGEGPELSLREGLAQAPDPRWPRGQGHPLTAILTLAVVVMLGGGRRSGIGPVPGLTREQTPCIAPLHPAFRRLDVVAFGMP